MTKQKMINPKRLFSKIDMTEGVPWKKLALFAVPLIIGNLFQQFYSIADAIILGRYIGDDALAAVGSSMPLLFLILVLMMGISIGVSIMVSQYFGARKREELSYTIGNGITLTAILGGILMIIGPLVSRPLLLFLDTPYEIIDDSVMYMNILMYGILGMAYFNILSGILRGLGDAFSPLLYLILTSILNVGFNYLFIGVLGWGMPAVAVGTVVSQGISSLLCLRKLMQMRDTFDLKPKYLKLKEEYTGQTLRLGVPAGASQAVIALAAMVVQPLVNSFGTEVIATNVIVMRIDGLVLMPIFSFGNAMTVFAGQNMGAGKIDRIVQGTKQGVIMAAGTAAFLVAIILLFGRFIANMFTNTQEVIDLSQVMLRILSPGFIVFSIAMLLWGAVRGAGDATSPMWASFVNTIVIRIPAAYFFVWLTDRPEALVLSMATAWTVNMFLAIIIYRKGAWKTKGIVKQQKEPPPNENEDSS